ncbi:hypothetical protein SLS64_012498 [Diaporthe eres]
MSVNQYGDEARERVVDETLGLIDHLDVHQTRSILRCFAIDDENFDAHALATVAKTVRATCDRSQCDYDATIHFPDIKTARLNRAHLLKSRAMSAETERQVVNYGNNEFWALRNYGVRMTGRAWNCCRRRPNAAGCHPEFHEPADSSESE